MKYKHIGYSSSKTIQRECCNLSNFRFLASEEAKTLPNARSSFHMMCRLLKLAFIYKDIYKLSVIKMSG